MPPNILGGGAAGVVDPNNVLAVAGVADGAEAGVDVVD